MEEEETRERDQFEGLIQGLMDNEFGCCNDFLPPSTILGLDTNIQNLFKIGKMKLSGFGNDSIVQKDTSVRGDKIHWIEPNSPDQYEMIYLKKIEKFILYLNKTCYTSIKSYESHCASYEKHSFYQRHLDQFKNEKGRKFSVVLYLNQDWKIEDEGSLSLFPKVGGQINVSPDGGRLVLFRSDEMEHEVHASNTRDRRSIAGWLKN